MLQRTKLINLINPMSTSHWTSIQWLLLPSHIASHRRVSDTLVLGTKMSSTGRQARISTLFTSTVAPRATLIIFTNPLTTHLLTNPCTIVVPRTSTITIISKSTLSNTIMVCSVAPLFLTMTILINSWVCPIEKPRLDWKAWDLIIFHRLPNIMGCLLPLRIQTIYKNKLWKVHH